MQRYPGCGSPRLTRPRRSRPLRARVGPMRVLVVDADEDRRDLICLSVGVLGHRAEEAWDLRQAVVALAAEAFDVVIVDDRIPGFDALEVTEFVVVAGRPARRRPAMVVVSDGLDVPRRAALFAAGSVDVVSRPLGLAPLHGLLARIGQTLPA